ncbi:MAG: PilT/PilU family type 4a pilus ATPase [Candidatus Roizmanbacteria bacterium]|nr:PilT/PilU family type 4a pilus ATPase [Candidatus Roizmanbacteria bacterium]
MFNIQLLLKETCLRNASDLHIVEGYYPTIRINSKLLYLREFGIVLKEDADIMARALLNDIQQGLFIENKEIDFSYPFEGVRFRVNLYQAGGSTAASFRLIPSAIKTIQELNLPDIFNTFTAYKQGLILFTGPTGEGKSTSLASIINDFNIKDSEHIVTIEDPIEFVYPKARSVISQREVGRDTLSWTGALRAVLREDPDIVLVGEMRDYETIQSVLTIAETGHLVFSTLHTGSASEAVNRIIDVFPSHQQNQIKSSLANSLIAVVAQRLVPSSDGAQRIPAIEVLLNNSAVAPLIRDGKVFQLDNVIETSEQSGMILFEKYLEKLYSAGRITKQTAYMYAVRKNIITHLIP